MAESLADAESVRFKGRKRLHYEDQWKRKKRKLMKDSGKAYETYKGEMRAAKTSSSVAVAATWNALPNSLLHSNNVRSMNFTS